MKTIADLLIEEIEKLPDEKEARSQSDYYFGAKNESFMLGYLEGAIKRLKDFAKNIKGE